MFNPRRRRTFFTLCALSAWSLGAGMAGAEDRAATGAAGATFEVQGDRAIAAMRRRAEELKIQGVGVVSYCPGEVVTSWTSKMIVVGHMTDGKSETNPGANLLAIAYSKSAEMADTLKNSGSGVRRPMTGEFGWQGGVVGKGKTGWLICAFSGGKSEDDVKVSQAGLEVLASAL